MMLRLFLSFFLSLAFIQADSYLEPKEKLHQLLEIVGMDSNCASMEQMNEWAQKHLIRKGERWELQNNKFEDLEDRIKPLLKDLGFVDAVSAHFQEYQGAIVHGAMHSRVVLRLDYLIEQWKRGVRFPDLYFISGERLLELILEAEVIPFAKNESEMVRYVWEHADVPQDMQKKVKVHFVSVPMKFNPISEKWERPNTVDTVVAWLETSPIPGRYLAVSNAPYIARQDSIIKSIAPDIFTFDTIGPKASEQEKMAIYLDEVARLLFFQSTL